jgi:non-homologous end joining protein Ku
LYPATSAVAKNEYRLLDKEDFDRVKLESTRILDIEKFVLRESIDRLYCTTWCRAAKQAWKHSP